MDATTFSTYSLDKFSTSAGGLRHITVTPGSPLFMWAGSPNFLFPLPLTRNSSWYYCLEGGDGEKPVGSWPFDFSAPTEGAWFLSFDNPLILPVTPPFMLSLSLSLSLSSLRAQYRNVLLGVCEQV
jgi:hypothetical protein